MDLKYICTNTNFKIATWLRKFLEAIRGDQGLRAVKHLNFRHMHWFNHNHPQPALCNTSVELAVACRNLRKLDITFHAEKVTYLDKNNNWVITPRPEEDIVSMFHLLDIFDCANLEDVYIDGIYAEPSRGGDPSHLDGLEALAKWMMRGFRARRLPRRGIRVEVVRRWGAWKGRESGEMVELGEEDLREVAVSLARRQKTDPVARCAYLVIS